MKLEITKERILEAASKCSTAKETLKTLFPEVFEHDKYYDMEGAITGDDNSLDASKLPRDCINRPIIRIRGSGEHKHRAFYLSNDCNWEFKKDSEGSLVLIPTKK